MDILQNVWVHAGCTLASRQSIAAVWECARAKCMQKDSFRLEDSIERC